MQRLNTSLKSKWQFGVNAKHEVHLRHLKMLYVKLITGGLRVNIKDKWVEAPTASSRAVLLKCMEVNMYHNSN